MILIYHITSQVIWTRIMYVLIRYLFPSPIKNENELILHKTIFIGYYTSNPDILLGGL